ncbi:MAG: hypothetical protein DIZ80_00965 [endosymbiont of Galathealinum brachiosum]|uniref:Oxidoreductase n=1 Tax=endosymbiont of Galathealinum brachiosum TaxID=2200906 RepID=A0A370DMC8_9GAMM|nr:MAG: hypothetical protein DIZ80_00965 [endosymbiont of Galathealinum brachiosum]
MSQTGPFHEGELAVQTKLGVSDIARSNGTVITNRIPGAALNFISQQSMVILGSTDINSRIWTSAIFGSSGFIEALDAETVRINFSDTSISITDPFWSNIQSNAQLGMIVIELGSRRRLRINGQIEKISEQIYHINIDQAYPNCPQYIQRRHIMHARKNNDLNKVSDLNGCSLNLNQINIIENADTFFVSSAHPDHGNDVSHRGGKPGFIQIINNSQLRIPDYPGNSMFNTLGNFDVNPNAGLVFIDFINKKILQLTGQAKVLWHIEDTDIETAGTLRYWQFDIESWRESTIDFDIEWEYLDASPHNPEITSNQTIENKTLNLTVDKIIQQSDRVKSFILTSDDKLPEFKAGAHLEITLNNDQNLIRHYSILSNPDNLNHYEIAVLEQAESRGGSHAMHHLVKQGDILNCSIPKNEFPVYTNAEHTILIAGGIGITPILSMLESLESQNKSYEFHYTVKTLSDFIYIDRIKAIAGNRCSFYTSAKKNSRLNLDILLTKPDKGTHVYVCGPVRLINAIREVSEINNWNKANVHFENFGVNSIKSNSQIEIKLAKSEITLTVPADISILDYLLNNKINVPHQCKRGECGLCVTSVLEGTPDHRDIYLEKEQRKSSMCLCVSRAKGNKITLDL